MRRTATFLCYLLPLLVLSICTTADAQNRKKNYPPVIEHADEYVYKTIGEVELKLWVFTPEVNEQNQGPFPAALFFFGGGWTSGSPMQFVPHAEYLKSRGMVGIVVDYRVASRHQVQAVSCVEDAKSSLRWVRQNAERLNIDPDRIVASGGSAGGHLAASTGILKGWEAQDEDLTISSIPNAMVLFNPAVVLQKLGDREIVRHVNIEKRVGTQPQKLSPYHHLRKGLPPCLILHGKADDVVFYWTVEEFEKKMNELGNQCRLVGYENQKHGYFNLGRNQNRNFIATTKEMDNFLVSLGYLSGEENVEQFLKQR